jgi:type II secretory pathway component GspD/PulD (secretin)
MHYRSSLIVALAVLVAGLSAFSFAFAREEVGDKAPEKPAATPKTPVAEPDDAITVSVGPEGVSVFAVKADAHALFTKFAKTTGLKLIVDDTVNRSITVNLIKKKTSEILDKIVASYGLACKQVNGVFMISEGIPKTPSSYLLSEIDAISTQYVLAPNAKSLLPIFLQDHVKTNQEQNSVILSAPPDVLKKFRQDILQFDIPASQIMIEVLMVEFSESGAKEFSLKANWANGGKGGTLDSGLGELAYRTIADLPNDFSVNLHALVTSGRAKVRANPKIATVSGQAASIFIGKQRYLSTPVAMSTDSYSGSQTNSIDAGVKLAMTPYTGGEGEIIVDISPEISVLSAPDSQTGLPNRSTRRANTMVHVRDGETIIIGGLTQKEVMKNRTKVPILGDIPFIGGLFRSHEDRETKTEMVIFITPRILSQTGHLPAKEEKDLKDRFLNGNGEPAKK